MKLRIKLSGQSRPIDFGDTDISSLTLRDLKESVSDTFLLENGVIKLSLNKTDVLTGDEVSLSDLGIVPGDLIHVISSNGSENNSLNGRSQRQQPATSQIHDSSVVSLNTNQHSQPNNEETMRTSQSSQTTVTSAVSRQPSDPSTSNSQGQNDGDEKMELENPIMENVKRSLQEPLVISESTPEQVPALLAELYASSDITCANEALFVLLHALMIESGFCLPMNADIICIPSEWKRPGFYMCTYKYYLTPDVMSECILMAVPIGSAMAVHGLSKTVGDFKTDHLQVKAENYVRDISQGNAATAYRSLDRVSKLFKDTICLPLQNHLATAAGFREPQGLLSLPCEVRMRLMCFLEAKDICNLGQTCIQWTAIYKDNIVWRRLYLLNFERPDDCSLSKNWYEMFKNSYQLYKEEEERRRRHFYVDVDDIDRPRFPGIPFGPFNPPMPRFLGGEHDLNPDLASGIPDLMSGGPLGRGALRGLPTVSDPFLPRRPNGRGNRNLTGSPFFRGGPFM